MHRDKSDRYEVQAAPSLAGHKRLGSYLVDAGLINRGQIEVALNDQKATGMKFGEVLATRGWIKQQTIEYFMNKIVLPERKASAQSKTSGPTNKQTPPDLGRRGVRHTPDSASKPASHSQPTVRQDYPTVHQRGESSTRKHRKTPPITKPLPSNNSGADGVPWVG